LTTAFTAANITPAILTVTGITANNKAYDGTATATLNVGSAALSGKFGSDVVTLNTAAAVGTFADKNVGNGIVVQVSGLTISGDDAGNYTLSQPTTTADITTQDTPSPAYDLFQLNDRINKINYETLKPHQLYRYLYSCRIHFLAGQVRGLCVNYIRFCVRGNIAELRDYPCTCNIEGGDEGEAELRVYPFCIERGDEEKAVKSQ
jgi:hypothetical protein